MPLWLQIIVLAVFISMCIWPIYFPAIVQKVLFSEDPPDTTVQHINQSTVIHVSVPLESEEKRLGNIQKMVDSTSGATQGIWLRQKAVLEQNMRWRRLEEFAGATQRVA